MNISKYLLMFALVGGLPLLMTSCEDFLTSTPESTYSAEGFYKTPEDFKYAIAGVYSAQKNLYNRNASWHRLIICRSDDTRTGAGYINGFDQFTDTDQVDHLLNFWQNAWVMISRCNGILDRIDAIDFADESDKNAIKGEAYGLRAWAYFYLGWQFGGVPLIDRELTVAETKGIARSSQEETFAFAAADFKKAIELLPEAWSGANLGRMTRYAAEAFYARMLMFQHKYSEAKPLLENVINSGKYGLEEDYVNCFTDSHDNGKERIYEIQFAGEQSGQGQSFAAGWSPWGGNGGFYPFAYSSFVYVSNELVDAYEEGDLRKDVSVITDVPNISGIVEEGSWYVRKYCHTDAYVPQNASDAANNIPIMRYADVLMMLSECLNEEAYNGGGEALNLLNQIRQRAGLPALTAQDVPNQDAFRKAIQKERRVEFAFEGTRWMDLVRWGIAKEVMDEFLKAPLNGDGRYHMDDFRTIFAIPSVEIERYNDVNIMWQNPGY